MKLPQGNTASLAMESSKNRNSQSKKGAKRTTTSNENDKLKASNFPASLLRIGNWEYASSYENDLVMKCYFEKQWEVLRGGLKSKIEIQWSNITALKATCADNDSGTLTILKNPEVEFDQVAAAHGYSLSSFQDVEFAAASQSPPLSFGQKFIVMDTCAFEWNGTFRGHDYSEQQRWEQLKVPGLQPSTSKSDLMYHIRNCISEQITSGCVNSNKTSEFWDEMENIKYELLSDTECATGANCEICVSSNLTNDSMSEKTSNDISATQENYSSGFGCRPMAPSMVNNKLIWRICASSSVHCLF
ncbi:unnamed protein product [Fraxinus pennsylvanica]|uniref:TRF2/HOY1 PH-like domain-containing protein n=1 Tax=Fraxinus pennsylvanica TaxID=56036 RepID=A0AAD2EA42_9LAMI|nr:unnamed protein product [Fraxinus pennsylvanica]